MSKQQLIETICRFNRSATEEFLGKFDESALTRYLNHLMHRLEPRGPMSMWIRSAETAAVVTRSR